MQGKHVVMSGGAALVALIMGATAFAQRTSPYYLTDALFVKWTLPKTISDPKAASLIHEQIKKNWSDKRDTMRRPINWDAAKYRITAGKQITIAYENFQDAQSVDGAPTITSNMSEPVWNCGPTELVRDFDVERTLRRTSDVTTMRDSERTRVFTGDVSVNIAIASAKATFVETVRRRETITDKQTTENFERRHVTYQVNVAPFSYYVMTSQNKRENVVTTVTATGLVDVPLAVVYSPLTKAFGSYIPIKPSVFPIGAWSDFVPASARAFDARATIPSTFETFTLAIRGKAFGTVEACNAAKSQGQPSATGLSRIDGAARAIK